MPADFNHALDLESYPIDVPDGQAYCDLLRNVRSELADDGCAVLKGFVPKHAIDALVAESDRVAPFAHRSFNETNIHFSRDNPDLPTHHPVRRFYKRSNAFVPADNLGPDSLLRQIYEWPAFADFIQACLNETSFFRYADPLADVIVNLTESGGGFPWHFDTNNYTVTLAIQNAIKGGTFEYCPNLRTSDNENVDDVRAVLDGTSDRVRTVTLEPGDLQIFKGRYSLHRVTPVAGKVVRYVAIFSFVERPDMVGSVERTRQLYGRVLPVHTQRAGHRADSLLD